MALTSYTHCKQYCVIGSCTLNQKSVFSSLGFCHFQNDHGKNSSETQERELVNLENVWNKNHQISHWVRRQLGSSGSSPWRTKLLSCTRHSAWALLLWPWPWSGPSLGSERLHLMLPKPLGGKTAKTTQTWWDAFLSSRAAFLPTT